jgi:hypothetical protein
MIFEGPKELRQNRTATQFDGMDAPLHNGIKRAKVVVSASHFTEEERPR